MIWEGVGDRQSRCPERCIQTQDRALCLTVDLM
jgi:hypothetical protein